MVTVEEVMGTSDVETPAIRMGGQKPKDDPFTS
jgi:hypothetical protein